MHLKLVAVAALATLATSNALTARQDTPTTQSVNPAKLSSLVPPTSPVPIDAATQQQLQQLAESQPLIWGRPALLDNQGLLNANVEADGQASKWGWGRWGPWGFPWWWSCYHPWYYGGWWW